MTAVPTAAGSPRRLVFIGGTSEPGGLHIHTADVAQACAALGCRVSIVCTSVNFFENLVTDPGIDIVVAPSFGRGRWRWSPGWWWLAHRYRGADVVFCGGHLGQTRLRDILVARLFGCRVYLIDHFPAAARKAAYGRLAGPLVRRLIAVSGEIADSAVRDFGFAADKVATCLNWVGSSFTPRTDREIVAARAALQLTPDTLVLSFVGRLAPEKRVDALLRAVAALGRPATSLLLVGDGWKRRELRALAGSLGIDDQVRVLGWVGNPRDILAASDLFVLPSLREGFPLALMEAMAVGCPCLAHTMSSTLELVADGENGVLADLSDGARFEAALRRAVALGRPLLAALGARAAQTIAERFSRERRLPEILAALDCALPSTGVPASRRGEIAFVSP